MLSQLWNEYEPCSVVKQVKGIHKCWKRLLDKCYDAALHPLLVSILSEYATQQPMMRRRFVRVAAARQAGVILY